MYSYYIVYIFSQIKKKKNVYNKRFLISCCNILIYNIHYWILQLSLEYPKLAIFLNPQKVLSPNYRITIESY